jgi:Right handed beta helix region
MTTRHLLIATLFAVCAGTAHAESKVLVLVGEVVDNQFIFGRNADDPPVLSQRVLQPNRGLHGISSEDTIIKPDSSVNNQNPIKAFVTTANFPNSGDAGPVERICLDGGQTINPAGQNDDAAHAIKIAAHRPAVRFCRITGWKGVGIETQFDPDQDLLATAAHQIIGNTVEFCHVGIQLGSGDQIILGNTVFACRDYGINGAGLASNVSIADNHIYACNGQTPSGVYDGICVYNPQGGVWRFHGNHFADTHYGYVSGGGDSFDVSFNGDSFAKLAIVAVKLAPFTTNHTFTNCIMRVPLGSNHLQFDDVVGYEFVADSARNHILGGVIENTDDEVAGMPGTLGTSITTGLRVAGDQCSVVETQFSDFQDGPITGPARGIHIPSAVQGFTADVRIWGYDDTGDVFLDVDSSTCTGLDIIVHGNSTELNENFPTILDHTNVEQYVSLPTGGLDGTNRIRFVNDATGQVLELDETQTYD